MVQELKTTNEANKGKKNIDLSALGDAGAASIVGEVQEKPKLLEPVLATIKSTNIVMTDRLQTNKNDASKVFYQGYLTVETEFIDPSTNELFTSKDSFGGLRFYVKVDEAYSPIFDEDGEPIISRLWIGDNSGLGKLLKLVQEHDESVVTYNDFLSYFKPGDKVKVCTLFTTFQGKQHWKEEIVEIL